MTTPPGYFEQLQDNIMQKITQEENANTSPKKRFSITFSKTVRNLSITAACLFGFTFGIYSIFSLFIPTQSTTAQTELVSEEDVLFIDELDLIDFIANNEDISLH